MTDIIDGNIYESIRGVLERARSNAYKAINFAMVEAYWEIGHRITDAQNDVPRAEYGAQLMKYLSERLSTEFGKGFDESNLRRMRQFYMTFPIRDTLCHELSWSHYRLLIKVADEARRAFYLRECAEANWSVRQLERQINSFFYERLLSTQKEDRGNVRNEVQKLEPKTAPDYLLKDPYILEFLDMKENKAYFESELEQGLIDHLQEFLLELGRGFSFVARQKRITIDGEHYYCDLVFYNFILKCFILVDLKAGKMSYQDAGQIDFYVQYFDECIKHPEDNPTIGIILCAEKGSAVAKYSVLAKNEQIFASKYRLLLPTEEELAKEIERERDELEGLLIDEHHL